MHIFFAWAFFLSLACDFSRKVMRGSWFFAILLTQPLTRYADDADRSADYRLWC
jgi:hypothetical protein